MKQSVRIISFLIKGDGDSIGIVDQGDMTLLDGTDNHSHQALTVGDLADQSRALGPILDRMGIAHCHVSTGDQGIQTLKDADRPFSLVICDQRLQGMKGTRFLSRVKEISPDTRRFLITRYSDMATIISAVNKGAVHQYISMPWDPEKIEETVRWGIRRYEHHLENDQLFTLAKTQNKRLYELNCELMETTKYHDRKSRDLDKEIMELRNRIEGLKSQCPLSTDEVSGRIIESVQAMGDGAQKELDTLYEQAIEALYRVFDDIALRNGIEMPDIDMPGYETPENKKPSSETRGDND